jgi:DNA-binding MarR family transcriptional regulator
MGPTNNLTYLIQHLSAVIGKQTEQALQEQLGIGLSQYRILLVLEWNPRIQQKSIASSLGQTEASISRQIKVLTSKGLLIAKPDPNNRRKHITAPTTLGMQITEAAGNILRRDFGPELSHLGDDRVLQMIASLQKLHKIVCKTGKVGACDHQLGF